MPEIAQDTDQYSTLTVQLNNPNDPICDRLYGLDSKKYKLKAASSNANPIVKIQPWTELDSALRSVKSSIIENLIIDGQNLDVTGIKLENVYNSWIRNVTIMNCKIGVHVHMKYGAWSEFNRLEHIRMTNVEKGIVFTTEGYFMEGFPGNSAAFTTIDDVGISLKNTSDAVGIQIGGIEDPNDVTSTSVTPYSSSIKANISMESAGGIGLKIINGELRYGLINLAVKGPSNGIGIDLTNAIHRAVYFNQFTKLTTDQYKNPDYINNPITGGRGTFLTCNGLNQDNWVKQTPAQQQSEQGEQTEKHHDIRAIGWQS